jgi:NAD+-dependent secondary alcohol dehydrogenase Adh1
VRAALLSEYETPLELVDRPAPEPRRPDEVVVKIGGAGVCATDLHAIDGLMEPAGVTLPMVLGHENAGWVEAAGDLVSTVAPGDPVIIYPPWSCGLCVPCRRGDDMHCVHHEFTGLSVDGGFADYVLVRERSLIKLPAGLEPREVAPHADAGLTAYHAVRRMAHLMKPGTTAVVIGIGGVGHIAVQLAKLHGCRVLTTAGRDESLAFCRDVLRADEVIDYRAGNVVEQVKSLTGGKGVPVAFDTVGGDVFVQCLDSVAVNGHVVTILGGSTDLRQRGQSLLYRNVTISYEFMGIPTAYEIEPERPGHILAIIAKLADTGALRPEVRHRFPLERLADAHRQVETGRTIGKVAVTVKG